MTEGQDREGTAPHSGARQPADGSLVGMGVGLARLYGSAWWRAAGWSLGIARQAFGVADTRARDLGLRRGAGSDSAEAGAPRPDASLRERGAELLRQAADVRVADDMHPAYERILGDLAPDEGRILRLLASEGPQPAVDVRTARPLGIGSRLVAPGLSMIAAKSGCRHRVRSLA